MAAIETLLDLAEVVHVDDLECSSDVVSALGRFGREVLEPALARHAVASARDVQERLAIVLTCCGVRDDRIFDALVRVLAWDDELGAMLLLDYGDPRVVPCFLELLDAPEIKPELEHLLEEAAQRWSLPRRGPDRGPASQATT